jgi:hypothetical protein
MESPVGTTPRYYLSNEAQPAPRRQEPGYPQHPMMLTRVVGLGKSVATIAYLRNERVSAVLVTSAETVVPVDLDQSDEFQAHLRIKSNSQPHTTQETDSWRIVSSQSQRRGWAGDAKYGLLYCWRG